MSTSVSSDGLPVSREELARRVIEPDDFMPDTEAFVDVRIERSQGKASYSFIGPGVSQNADQKINLAVPHGFNVGAASMPSGVVNNPHLHYTAEVFVCTRGSFRMDIGRNAEQSIDLGVGDVFAAPTWVFRGFTNTGPDDSWVFVALGGDDTGGIIWSPDVLREAADTGLHLAPDNSIIDAAAGQDASGAVAPIHDDALEGIDSYSDDELAAHLVKADDRAWTDRGLLSAVLDGHASHVASVLGHGMSEDRRHQAPIMTAQGFSIEWLRVDPGCSTGLHRIAESQVLLLAEGDWQVSMSRGDDQLDAKPATGSVVSVPPSAWRNFSNVGSTPAIAAVICGTDSPNRIEWDADIVAAARAAGWVRDAAGKIAPLHLLPGGRA
jgi:mannose-6-phosphate isomerase-like protein (cupin superfamily)